MTKSFPPLMEILAQVPDPRHRKGRRYELRSILALLCAAMLCGYRTYSAAVEWGEYYGDEFRRILGFRRGRCPCKSTLCQLLRRLDIQALNHLLSQWAESVLEALASESEPEEGVSPARSEEATDEDEEEDEDESLGEAFALDGKAFRGSAQQGARFPAALAVLSHRLGIPLLQRPTRGNRPRSSEDGERCRDHEVHVVKQLLKDLLVEGRLSGRIWTMDAAHTLEENAKTIVKGGGHYVMPVKKNQGTLRKAIHLLFEDASAPKEWFDGEVLLDTGHGRIEIRRIRTSSALNGYLEWPGAQQVFCLQRWTRLKRSGEEREDRVYGITSLSSDRANPEQLLRLVRGHWAIENRLHWVRDVTFDEDRSQVRAGNTPQVMATLRNVVITLIRLIGETNVAAACRRFAARPHEAMALIGAA